MVYKITLWLATGNSDLLGPISKYELHEESVTPAKAGVHLKPYKTWIPAFAGMTD